MNRLFAAAAVAVVLLPAGRLDISLQAAPPEQTRAAGDGFSQTTLGDTLAVEWAAFTGVVEWLDGPSREGMGRQMGGSSVQGCLRGMGSDDAGNIFMCDMTSSMIRALRKRDGRLLTISGNGHMTAGRVPQDSGPTYRLGLDQLVYIDATGDALEGDGQLYIATQGRVLRLFRNQEKGGLWWYQRIAGGGKQTIDQPGTYDALSVSLREPRVIVSAEGKVALMRRIGGGVAARTMLFWLADGKLTTAYDEAAIQKQLNGRYFSCYGIDGAGSFAGYAGDSVVVVAADGKSVIHDMMVPVRLPWGVYPDRQRSWWFVKGMDHYSITRVNSQGNLATLLRDGSWAPHDAGGGNRAYNIRSEMLGWMWGLPLRDGRYIGWNSHGCLPLFVGTWLEQDQDQ